MITPTTIIVDFVYFLDKVIPDLMCGSVAYRRVKQSCVCNERVKIIKCPHCRERLADVPISTTVRLYQNPNKVNRPCHSYMRCLHCKSTVGLMMQLA